MFQEHFCCWAILWLYASLAFVLPACVMRSGVDVETALDLPQRLGGYAFLMTLWMFGWFFLVMQHARPPQHPA